MAHTKEITLEYIVLNNSEKLALEFGYNNNLISLARKLKGRWNPTLKKWIFDISQLEVLKKEFSTVSLSRKISFSEKSLKIPQAFIDTLERRRYSPNTIKAYVSLFEQFLNYYPDTKPEMLTDKHVAEFQTYLVKIK
jgi:hypothetical protein